MHSSCAGSPSWGADTPQEGLGALAWGGAFSIWPQGSRMGSVTADRASQRDSRRGEPTPVSDRVGTQASGHPRAPHGGGAGRAHLGPGGGAPVGTPEADFSRGWAAADCPAWRDGAGGAPRLPEAPAGGDGASRGAPAPCCLASRSFPLLHGICGPWDKTTNWVPRNRRNVFSHLWRPEAHHQN